MQESGFFNSSGGDRVYDAADFASYFSKLVSNGIFYAAATNLQVTADSGMLLNVFAGSAWVNGHHYENTDTLTFSLATADGINSRVDHVIVRLSMVDREIKLAVLTGAALPSPIAPALTRTADVYELGIADILVPEGTGGDRSSKHYRYKADTALCGLVNSLVSAVYE